MCDGGDQRQTNAGEHPFGVFRKVRHRDHPREVLVVIGAFAGD
jgi:hypothetical protein